MAHPQLQETQTAMFVPRSMPRVMPGFNSGFSGRVRVKPSLVSTNAATAPQIGLLFGSKPSVVSVTLGESPEAQKNSLIAVGERFLRKAAEVYGLASPEELGALGIGMVFVFVSEASSDGLSNSENSQPGGKPGYIYVQYDIPGFETDPIGKWKRFQDLAAPLKEALNGTFEGFTVVTIDRAAEGESDCFG